MLSQQIQGIKMSIDNNNGSTTVSDSIPYFANGEVVKGFGRGSKELGIPTANFPEDVVDSLPESFDPGVYYGWACVDRGPVYKMVMSVGWNPHYQNEKKSMETHILHKFPEDFYGSELKVCVCGYIRPELKFNSLKELIAAIHSDIDTAEKKLEDPAMQRFARELEQKKPSIEK